MKLYYITRVSIPAQSAQSIQITAMCKAFFRQKVGFKFISPESAGNVNLAEEFDWEKIKLSTKFKYLEFAFKSFVKTFKEKPSHVYTRDIVIAYLLSFLKIKVIYEAHKEPMSKTASLFMALLVNKNNFFLVTISKALKNYYIESYSFKDDKVLSCHDGVFLEKYDKLADIPKKQLRQELNLPIDKIIVMHTGSMYKGNDAMLFESVVNNFEDANELRDKEVFVDKKIIENLFTTNKVFFCENWLNHNVYSEQGELLGIVNDIIYTAGNDVISVINDKEETLIPVVSDYILSEDTKKATLTVKKPEYL